MRYFAEIAYQGTNYFGWQRQPEEISVQQVIEEAFSTILRTEIIVTGCGRTDTGVHASQYFFHFDFNGEFPDHFSDRLNKYLPKDIGVYRIFQVGDEAHARFDALSRSYRYEMILTKNPFKQGLAWTYFASVKPDLEAMQTCAGILLEFEDFTPFCKSQSDAKTMKCQLFRSEWVVNEMGDEMVYHISANRFLRGMVRLIVGACLYAGQGLIKPEEVRLALQKKQALNKAYSVPPQGLYLSEVKYPYF